MHQLRGMLGFMEIQPGVRLQVVTASDATVTMRALSRPVKGRDFPIVWVCTEDEYENALADGGDAEGIPWPLSAVKLPEHA